MEEASQKPQAQGLAKPNKRLDCGLSAIKKFVESLETDQGSSQKVAQG